MSHHATQGAWVKRLITGVVLSIASCAVLLFAGCSIGALEEKQCEEGQDKAFGVLTALLTTVMGLAVKLDALEEPTPELPPTKKVTRRPTVQQ